MRRKIGIKEIEDMALGATVLGAGGGGDPYAPSRASTAWSVLLFWGASSLMGIAQQQISMRIMKKRDAEAAETIEVKPIEVDVTRKQKKPRPTKKDTTKRK